MNLRSLCRPKEDKPLSHHKSDFIPFLKAKPKGIHADLRTKTILFHEKLLMKTLWNILNKIMITIFVWTTIDVFKWSFFLENFLLTWEKSHFSIEYHRQMNTCRFSFNKKYVFIQKMFLWIFCKKNVPISCILFTSNSFDIIKSHIFTEWSGIFTKTAHTKKKHTVNTQHDKNISRKCGIERNTELDELEKWRIFCSFSCFFLHLVN